MNKPSSGTYGEGAELDRLKQSLPAGAVGQPPAPAPAAPTPLSPEPLRRADPAAEGRPKTAAAAPPGVPSVLLEPTTRPEVPVTTPLQPMGSPSPSTASSAQQRLAVLDMLSSSPNVSAATREWAANFRDALLGVE